VNDLRSELEVQAIYSLFICYFIDEYWPVEQLLLTPYQITFVPSSLFGGTKFMVRNIENCLERLPFDP